MKNLFTLIFIFVAFTCFSQIPSGYYNNAEGLQGEELKTALYNIIKNHAEYPYTSSTTDVWDILKETDKDPANSDNVILIYTGQSVNAAQEYNSGSGWSREHVWAKSHGDFGEDPPAGTDTHHLRPCDISVNSARGNKDFDNGGSQHSEATECYTDADSWEPRPTEKGDVARMMFYMATRYEGESGEPDLELVDYTGTDGPIFGKLSTLIQWNTEDPVDEFERNRNEVVYSYQGNRNPFIDHPEYVNLIYNPSNTAPVIDNQTFSIAENSPTGTEIGTIVASDLEDDALTYSISNGNVNDAFALGGTTGILTVNNASMFDYESIITFNLTVAVSDGSASSSATIKVNVDNVNAVDLATANTKIQIYPNPVTGILYINAPENYSIEIYSVIGKKMLSTESKQVDVHHLDAGIYFIAVKNEIGKTIKSEKIIKK